MVFLASRVTVPATARVMMASTARANVFATLDTTGNVVMNVFPLRRDILHAFVNVFERAKDVSCVPSDSIALPEHAPTAGTRQTWAPTAFQSVEAAFPDSEATPQKIALPVLEEILPATVEAHAGTT